MTPSDTDIAWLAGLMEGEGWFRLAVYKKQPKRRPQVEVGLKMTDLDVVQNAVAIIGSTRPIKPCKKPTGDAGRGRSFDRWSPQFEWRVYGAQAERVMRLVRPYMGQRRGARIDQILSAPLGTYSHQPRIKESS